MKKIVYLAMFMSLSLASVQCTKTVEERIVERERTNTILSGATAPTATIGSVGDYYIDLTSVNLYGPKTAEGWGNPISLRGLQGQNGTDGQNGQDAPIPHIGDDGYWYIGNTKTTVKAQGNNGSNGETPHIGNNGNWFVGNRDTGVKAKGEKGNDGEIPRIGDNGNWFVGNRDTEVKAQGNNGSNGETPHIGNNGNWFIGNRDLGVKAKGEKGNDGETPRIGDNGNWFVGNRDTGVKAQGNNGSNGETPHIGNNGNWFIGNRDLGVKAKGEKGNDGETPRIGDNGNWFVGNRDLGIKAKGEKGEKGNDGQNGADAPKPNIKDGYWYIGNVNTNIKAQGERGLPGKDGSKIYAGQGNPPANTGREGDYYINTEDKIFYGPKTNTGWPSTGISLSAQQIITTDYELSPDGKTLLKWKNSNTHFIDMNADPKLKDVENIAELAFNGEQVSYELRTFVIGNKVKSIGAKAFNGCFRLTTVEADENKTTQITEIKEQTFANCNHLQNIDIPSSVTTIGKRAFIGCYKLTTVILPEKVNKIEDQAFMQCKNLHTLIAHNPTAFSINKKAFIQTHLRNIYVPSQKADSYKALNADYKDIIK